MKITCPKCTAQQDIQEALIPQSGMVRCQACMNQIHVIKQVAARGARPAEPARLPRLVDQEDEFTPPAQAAHQPAPSRLPPTAGMVSPVRPAGRDPGVSDLPAPVGQSGRGVSDLPAPVGQSGRGVSDLPAPVGFAPRAPRGVVASTLAAPRGVSDLPAPVGPAQKNLRGVSDLPAPVGSSTRRAPATSAASIPLVIDLPGLPDAPLPAPRRAGAQGSSDAELPAPVQAQLPAPVQAGLPAPVQAGLLAPVMPGLPSPVMPGLPSPVMPGLMTPAHASRQSQPLILGDENDEPAYVLEDDGEPIDLQAAVDLASSSFDSLGAGRRSAGARSNRQARPAAASPAVFGDAAMLGLVLEDLPPPPPREGPPKGGGSPSSLPDLQMMSPASQSPPPMALDMEDNADQLTQPILPGELPPPPGGSVQRAPSVASLFGNPGDDANPASHASMLPVLGPNGESIVPGLDLPDLSAVQPAEVEAEASTSEAAPASPRNRRRLLLIAAGALVGLGAVGAASYVALSGRSKEELAVSLRTRLLIGEDQVSSCKKAAEGAHSLVLNRPTDGEFLGLEAQARLCVVRHGVASELRAADERIGQIAESEVGQPEAVKAKALRALLRNQFAEARRLLDGVPNKDKDSLLQVYLGWTELASNRYAAAEKDFARALAINGKLVAAQLGIAQAKEHAGDRGGAQKAYAKVLSLKADHFLGAIGALRVSDDPSVENRLIDTVKRLKALASDHEQAEVWASLGLRALEAGRGADAEDRLRKALAADATLPLAKVALARINCDKDRKDKYIEAANLVRDVVKNDPRNLEAGLLLVRALIGSQQPLSAGGQAETLAKLYPKDARVAYWQGRREEAVNAKDSGAKAEAHYKKALEADPKYLDAYIALARVLQAQGKNTDALAALKQVAEVAKSDADVAAALCSAYLGTREYSQAVQACRVALGLKPKLYRARIDLATALEGQGQLEAAITELIALRQEVKDYPGLVERLARLYLRLERYPQAEQAFLDAAGQSGATTALRLQAARLCLTTRPKDARPLLDRVLREDPRSALARLYLGVMTLAEAGNDPSKIMEASLLVDQANKAADLPEIHLVRARVQLAQDKRSEAMASLLLARKGVVEARALLQHAQLLLLDNGQADAMSELTDLIARSKSLMADPIEYRPQDRAALLGVAYEMQGDLHARQNHAELAIRAYEQAAARNPADGALAFRLAKALQAVGKKQPAAQQLQRALKLSGDKAPFASEAYLMLGDMYKERHQRAEAIRNYRKWLELSPLGAPERHDIELYVDRQGR